MKNWIISIVTLFLLNVGYSQTFPEGMSYQAQVFSSTGAILSNVSIGLQFNIRSNTMSGSIVWQETHTVTVNEVGHFSVIVGQGTSTGAGSISSFSQIPWGEETYFIEMLVDENNVGTFISTMTQQLIAVPFAFHSKTSSQTYNLNGLQDVDTAGLQIGDILEWNGSQWVPGIDDMVANADTAQYAFSGLNSVYSDTANYAQNCVMIGYVDTADYATTADTANYAYVGGYSIYSDSASYADTAGVALFAVNNWGIDGNNNTDGINNFLGTVDSVDLILKSYNTERMRFKANGDIGIGTSNPLCDFHVNNTDGVLLTGTFGTGNIPTQGGGTRMMWYPGKGAFRCGYVASTNWDDFNIGLYSFGVGYNVKPTGDYSFAAGFSSEASGEGSFAVGNASLASGYYAVAMGHNPQATGPHSIAIGRGTVATDSGSVAIGYHAEVYSKFGLGFGNYAKVYGNNGVAMGFRAECLHNGSFIYSDESTPLASTLTTADNQFMVKASGGTIFYTSSDLSTGVELPAGGGAWSTLSDSSMKENITPLDPMVYLNKLDSIEVFIWNYITQDSAIRHIGPMAQDFYSTFEIGEDSTMISTVDFDGINLILLQALYIRCIQLEEQQLRLENVNAELEILREERKAISLLLLDLERRLEENEQNTCTTENVQN